MDSQISTEEAVTVKEAQKIKCVVWDLDHTVWSGILSEGDTLEMRPGVRELMETLDARGILQSIASKNDHAPAWERLRSFGIDHLFLYPQVSWGTKSQGIRQIAKALNIGLDTFAFIDDQPFEREEVQFELPEVRVYDVTETASLAALDDFNPRFVTGDSRLRRQMYQTDIARKTEEDRFGGPNEAFLASLDMPFTIAPAQVEDLQRVEELTQRTHQLNTTGETFSYDDLAGLLESPRHRLLVCELTDRFGGYGKIGVVLLESGGGTWTIRLLLMSCRVISRGVGGALLTLLRQQAREQGVRLRSLFRETDRNRMMYVTYRFAGFNEVEKCDGLTLLENDLSSIPPLPGYLKIDARI